MSLRGKCYLLPVCNATIELWVFLVNFAVGSQSGGCLFPLVHLAAFITITLEKNMLKTSVYSLNQTTSKVKTVTLNLLYHY